MIWPGSRRHQEQRKQLQRKQKCKIWEKEEVMMLVCIYITQQIVAKLYIGPLAMIIPLHYSIIWQSYHYEDRYHMKESCNDFMIMDLPKNLTACSSFHQTSRFPCRFMTITLSFRVTYLKLVLFLHSDGLDKVGPRLHMQTPCSSIWRSSTCAQQREIFLYPLCEDRSKNHFWNNVILFKNYP